MTLPPPSAASLVSAQYSQANLDLIHAWNEVNALLEVDQSGLRVVSNAELLAAINDARAALVQMDGQFAGLQQRVETRSDPAAEA